MEYVIYFIVTFLIVYAISYLLIVRKKDKYDEGKIPVEVQYMIRKYKLDMKKINYKKFLKSIALVGSLDMTIAAMIIFPIENIIIQILLGFITLIPLILLSFHLLAKYYIKKGNDTNERKNTRNRK